MSKAQASIQLISSAERVWHLVGGFDSLPEWIPSIAQSKLIEGGRVRCLKTCDGIAIIERLLHFNESERSYTYTQLQGPASVRDYQSTLRVIDMGGTSKVEWSGSFTPVDISETQAVSFFESIYKDGLSGLKLALGNL